jgi:hypothetical protein
MNKYALCLSGQIRYLEECFPLIKQNIIDQNNGIDIFIHCWRTDSSSNINKCIDLYNPMKISIENQVIFDTKHFDAGVYADGIGKKRVFNIMSMYYSIYKANELKSWQEYQQGDKYKYVARSRFDWAIREPLSFEQLKPTNQEVCAYNDCTHEFGCLTDHFAFGTSEAMDKYSNMFFNFDKVYLKQDFCSEILLGRWIRYSGLSIKQIPFKHRQFIYHP